MICLNPCSNGRYSQSGGSLDLSGTGITVLILVLMEDTLREERYLCQICSYSVLILVLMEDTLREGYSLCQG